MAFSADSPSLPLEAESWVTIPLPTVVESAQIAQIRDQLLEALADQRSVRLDTRDVCRVSTAAAQVLVAAGTSFGAAGLKVAYADPSDAFIEAFSDLGLYAHLADHIAISD
jgi:anti-anti-sigma regulatory factor